MKIMGGKGFHVRIYFDLNLISCPGVWLCPNGTVALRLTCLDSYIDSKKVSPVFPLTFEDKFLFKKTFTDAATLAQLQYDLKDEYFYAELVQWPSPSHKVVILATFEISLADLLYPAPCFKGLISGIDIDLLMEPSKYFPGIIAPKIEISTRTVIEETELCELDTIGAKIINPKVIQSKGKPCIHRKRPPVGIIRQKRVCHAPPGIHRSTHRCGCGQNIPSSPDEIIVPCPAFQQRAHLDQCYHKSNRELRSYHSLPSRGSITNKCICSSRLLSYHDLDACPVCSRYQLVFAKGARSNATYSIRNGNDNRQEVCCAECNARNCPQHSRSTFTGSRSTLRERIRNFPRSH